jgi:hypothetical protein
MSEIENLCDVLIKTPYSKIPLIQDCHASAAHLICAELENKVIGTM